MKGLLTFILIVFCFKASSQIDGALAIADSLYGLGDYSKAIDYYKKTGDNAFKIAKSYEALGDNVKSLEYYRKVLATKPNAIIVRYNYGRLLFKTAKYEEADSVFHQLRQQQPRNPNFPYYSGLIKEKQKDSTALTHFKRALSLDNNHQDARYKIAKRLVEKRKFVVALPLIKKGLSNNPSSISFINLQALAYFYSENYHGSTDSYLKLIALNQSNPRLHENLGVSYTRTMRFEQAIDQFTILINTFDDTNPKWHYQIANAYMALRYYDKAIRHFEIAIALKDLSVEQEYLSLSILYSKQKDYKAQMKALRKVISENPKNEKAYYFLATAADNFYKDKGDAIPYYEEYLKRFGEKGLFREYASQRIKDIKTELHFTKD